MSNEIEAIKDPGLPAHVHRKADTDPVAEKRAERQVAILFLISALGTLLFIFAYYFIPEDVFFFFPVLGNTNAHQLFLGLGLAIALFFIGAAAIHWAKTLMPDEEVIAMRHTLRSADEDRDALVATVKERAGAAGLGAYRGRGPHPRRKAALCRCPARQCERSRLLGTRGLCRRPAPARNHHRREDPVGAEACESAALAFGHQGDPDAAKDENTGDNQSRANRLGEEKRPAQRRDHRCAELRHRRAGRAEARQDCIPQSVAQAARHSARKDSQGSSGGGGFGGEADCRGRGTGGNPDSTCGREAVLRLGGDDADFVVINDINCPRCVSPDFPVRKCLVSAMDSPYRKILLKVECRHWINMFLL